MVYTKFINCETLDSFNTSLESGVITDSCVVFIKEAKQIWTHGQFYPCPYTKDEIESLISNNKVTKNDIEKVLTGNITSHTHNQYLTSETDPTVPSWAKNPSKPTYTYSEVGAASSSHNHDGVYSKVSDLNNKADIDQNMYIGTTSVPINRRSGELTLNDVNITGKAGYIERDRDSNTVYSLSNIPISKSTVVARLSYASSFSLNGSLNVGESITIICIPSASFSQPIPTSGIYYSMDGDSISVESGKYFEINIYCYEFGKYSISSKVSK